MTSNDAALVDDEEWEYPVNNVYQHYIVECMHLKHIKMGKVTAETEYPKTMQFSKDELLTLTPSDIKRYLYFKAFHKTHPGPDDYPKFHRAGSLSKVKQGVSWFMPNKNVPWIEGRGGNPTRHCTVQGVIKKVEEMEARNLGSDANDKRPYSDAEFNKVLEVFRRDFSDFDHKIKYPTMTLWAYHLIHRVDDTSNFKVGAPHGCIEWPFAIKTRTRWSKNVKKMKHCPDQILFGSEDWLTCVLLWLSIYLESWLMDYPNADLMWTSSRGEKAAKNVKKNYGNNVAKIWKLEEFKALQDTTGDDQDRGLGTHSERKYSADKAKTLGAKENQIEYRGRWLGEKGSRVVARVYVRADEPFIDAFVAGLLCNGGPIRYEFRDGCAMDDNWLFTQVIPNIRQRFIRDDRFCRIMGLCMLWAAFHVDASEFLPSVEVDRIRSSYQLAKGEQDENPVIKIKLVINPVNEYEVDIVDQSAELAENEEGRARRSTAANGGISNEQILAHLQQEQRRRQQWEAKIEAEVSAIKPFVDIKFQQLVTNQRRFGGTISQAFARQSPQYQQRNRYHQAAVYQQQQQRGVVTPQAPRQPPTLPPRPPPPPPRVSNQRVRLGISPYAKLEKNLKNLHEFWEEYMFGIGENKAAKDFTKDERNGQGKPAANKYSRRLKIWRLQAYLTRVGYTIEAANQRIIDVYGHDKPTPIIFMIMNEQKNPAYQFVGSQRFNPRFIVNTN